MAPPALVTFHKSLGVGEAKREPAALSHWPEVPIQPVQRLADDVVASAYQHSVRALQDDVPLVLLRRSEQAKHGNLRDFDRKGRVIPAVQHQNRDADSREEVDRVLL